MRTILDFHIHSKYSRACSRDLELANIAVAAERKGIDIVGTGDFTYPAWFQAIASELQEDAPGIFKLKNKNLSSSQPRLTSERECKTRFALTTELSCIYKHKEAVRRLHNVILAPSIEAVSRLNKKLESLGCNLRSDGRPILGLSSKQLLQTLLDIDENFEMIPAHAWTPWFAIFGSKSGYNSIEECFEDLTPHIHAIETGLSSDPKMNLRLSALDKIVLVSNSDAHSLGNLGREANVFDLSRCDYFEILEILRAKELHKFLFTIEFFPEEGKYHFDGHRECKIVMSPQESKRAGGVCPKCKKQLTFGVAGRVEELADRKEQDVKAPQGKGARVPYKSIVPLAEIIGCVEGVGAKTKKVKQLYDLLLNHFGTEFNVLLDVPYDDLSRAAGLNLAEAVMRVREGRITVSPGYDGEYGKVQIFTEGESIGPRQERLL